MTNRIEPLTSQQITHNFATLVNDRIRTLDHPRKTSLLRSSSTLKPQGLTVLPFPEFDSTQGRRLPSSLDQDTETISYTRSDALNMLMALAGNDEPGELRSGSLETEVRQQDNLVQKIRSLVNRLNTMPDIDSVYDDHLFQNELTDLNIEVPKRHLDNVIDLPLGDEARPGLVSQGFVLPIADALRVIEQIVDHLNSTRWVNSETGKIIESEYAGLIGCFYDKSDAQYLAKMLNNFVKQ